MSNKQLLLTFESVFNLKHMAFNKGALPNYVPLAASILVATLT